MASEDTHDAVPETVILGDSDTVPDRTESDGLWIFGYGSLVWKVGFPFAEKHAGYIKGWKRRFYQASPDHRGTEEAPGRVVTLMPAGSELEAPDESDEGRAQTETFGVVYRLEEADREEVMKRLWVREKAGYSAAIVQVHCQDGVTRAALVFMGTPDNDHFAGPAPYADLAAHIARSVGPSGPNPEYVLNLATALDSYGVSDPHITRLTAEVRRVLATASPAP